MLRSDCHALQGYKCAGTCHNPIRSGRFWRPAENRFPIGARLQAAVCYARWAASARRFPLISLSSDFWGSANLATPSRIN
jgi:hypothetical protein